jgi:4-hydroxyphenylacetate 3-monooxygenase
MLRSGKEHLESIRDGRIVYIGSERVDDVTRHPAFRNVAQTVAALYDMKADPALREEITYEEDDGRHSIYFLRARSRDDLQRRMIGHRRIADFTYGMFGRSPDHVSSFVTGMAMKADELKPPSGHPNNLLAYYPHIRDNDIYPVYAVVPPQAARNPEFYHRQNLPVPTLRVVREDDSGVIISGMKMLATGAVFANEIWIGNVIPLAPDQKKEAITCAVPCNAKGLQLWSRQPAEINCVSEFDSPLAYRYDESDSILLCNEMKVPWERVFVHDDALLSRDIYVKNPEPLLRKPSVKRQVLVENATVGRACQHGGECDCRRPGPGSQRNAWPNFRPGSHDRRHGQRSDQCLRNLAGRYAGLRLFQPADDVCRIGMVHAKLQ